MKRGCGRAKKCAEATQKLQNEKHEHLLTDGRTILFVLFAALFRHPVNVKPRRENPVTNDLFERRTLRYLQEASFVFFL